jgi:PAS domain S-box-containing protein/diguanylate cyclase (GGDEF)-like protein
LSLSESDALHVSKDVKFLTHKSSMLKSLTHLVNVSQDDLNISINNLNQYKLILDNSSIVSKADLEGNITYVNDEFCKVSGYTREELLGKKHSIVKHPDTRNEVFQKMWKMITSKNIWSSTIKNRKKNGDSYYVKSVIMPLLDENGEISEYIASRTDVTELIKKEKLIKAQFEDELTGLHSRGALLHDLLVKPDSYASLILINIDRFSDINDYFGYETGDELLRVFAKKLQNGHQKAYRISGDEFALLCEHELNDENRNEIASMLIDLETSEYQLFEESISIFLSCGVSYSKKKELYKLSHIALKKNKYSNEPVTYYNDFKDLENKIKENLDVILRIKEGLKYDRFVPFYQGIADNKTKKIVKYEALIRLKCDDGRIEPPFFFLEHAKKSKLYTKLTKVMIKKTFEKFADLEYEFSINLLLQDIESPKVIKCLVDNLEKYQCGKRVVLEIVESEGIYNFDLVSKFINMVKSYGCKIAIDDFGTGYSNFSYLAKLDIDYIKIDGSLVKDIDKDLVQMATVESILHFARKVGIKTIAEYVENEIIYNHLYDLGVDFSQGYYFSKPQEELL